MFLKMFVQPTEALPGFRHWAWRRWYQHIAGYGDRDWAFMNYGFVPDSESAAQPILSAEDESDRYCIQLYHRVAEGTDLTGNTVVEIGSGRGGGASFIKRYLSPGDVTGIDYSLNAIRFSERRHSVAGLRFVKGDAAELPLDDNSTDVVFNVESSHCYPSMAGFLGEVRRILRPGGLMLFADFRAAAEIPALTCQIEEAGLEIIRREDISEGVVRAMRMDSDRKHKLIKHQIPRWLQPTFSQFAGVQDSEVFRGFEDGSLVYETLVAKVIID